MKKFIATIIMLLVVFFVFTAAVYGASKAITISQNSGRTCATYDVNSITCEVAGGEAVISVDWVKGNSSPAAFITFKTHDDAYTGYYDLMEDNSTTHKLKKVKYTPDNATSTSFKVPIYFGKDDDDLLIIFNRSTNATDNFTVFVGKEKESLF